MLINKIKYQDTVKIKYKSFQNIKNELALLQSIGKTFKYIFY